MKNKATFAMIEVVIKIMVELLAVLALAASALIHVEIS
jgi:hypothetical protein